MFDSEEFSGDCTWSVFLSSRFFEFLVIFSLLPGSPHHTSVQGVFCNRTKPHPRPVSMTSVLKGRSPGMPDLWNAPGESCERAGIKLTNAQIFSLKLGT